MRIAGFIALVVAACLPLAAAAAGDPASGTAAVPPPKPPMVLAAVGEKVADGSDYQVRISGLQANVTAGFDPGTLTLRLDGQELTNKDKIVDRQKQTVTFKVRRQLADQDKWQKLAGSPPLDGHRNGVKVGVGPAGRPDFDYDLSVFKDGPPIASLQLFYPLSLLLAVGLELALLVAMILLGRKTSVLRNPSALPPAQRQYSMARCQMAFWFVLITGAFLFIWGLTGQYNGIITPQSLTLLGISGLTGLGAAGVDAMKGDPAPPPAPPGPGPAPPPAPAPVIPVHTNFLNDILTDTSGVVLHRVQILAWTLILGVISIWSVYANLSLPPLDQNLLILMGISSGLYVGLKFPEQQTT